MNARTLLISRSVAVIGGIGALIAGVTFAAVGDLSSVSLTGNTLSASASLQIAPDSSGTPGTYLTTVPGFNTATNAMRFGFEKAAGDFWLKNVSTGDQSVVVTIPANAAPAITGVTAAKVHVHIKQGATDELNTTLDKLITPAPGVVFTNHVSPSTGGIKYSLYYTIDAPAGGGVTANVGTFDLNFTGTEL